MIQDFKTTSCAELTDNTLNSDVYIYIQNLINKLSSDEISSKYKCILEAICTALLKGEHVQQLAKRISGERRKKLYSLIPLSIEDAKADIAEIKRLREFAHTRPLIPGSKKLERYHSEVLALHKAEASYRDIKFWLLSKKKFLVSHHTIQRYLNAISNHEKKEI